MDRRHTAPWLLGLLASLLLAVVGLVVMTVLKEVNGLSGRPIGWR